MNYAGKRLRREKKKKPDQNAKKTKKLKNMCAVMADTDRYWPILADTTTDTHGFGCGFGRFRADTKRAKKHVSGHDRYRPIPADTQTDTRSNGSKPADTQTVTPAQKSVMKHFLHFPTSKPSKINQARPQTVDNYF